MEKENQTNKTIGERFEEIFYMFNSDAKRQCLSFISQELKNILEELRMEERILKLDEGKIGYSEEDFAREEDEAFGFNHAVQKLNTKIDNIAKREGLEIKK